MSAFSTEFESTTRFECDNLLSKALSLAKRQLSSAGGFPPFCLAISIGGEVETLVSDSGASSNSAALVDALRDTVKERVARLEYRAVAFARNVVLATANKEEMAVQVSIDHASGIVSVTCYLPFQFIEKSLVEGEIYATECEERFFA